MGDTISGSIGDGPVVGPAPEPRTLALLAFGLPLLPKRKRRP